MVEEEWRQIVGYEGLYSVSSTGRIRRDKTNGTTVSGKMLKIQRGSRRYPVISLWKDGKLNTHRVHKLVMVAFVGPYPAGHSINHKDGVRSNNVLSNLEFVTHKENSRHAVMTGLHHRGERSGNSKLTSEIVKQIRALHIPHKQTDFSMPKLAKRFGVAYSTIKSVISGKTWAHV